MSNPKAYKVQFEGLREEIKAQIVEADLHSPDGPSRCNNILPPGLDSYGYDSEEMPSFLGNKRISLIKRYRQEFNLGPRDAMQLANLTLTHLARN